MVTFANSYLTAMREAGDPRKDNQILSDGQTKFLELKASAEPRGIAATAAQTTAATGQADSLTKQAAVESADFARVANARNQVAKELNDAIAARSHPIGIKYRKAKQVDSANEESNARNKGKQDYVVLETDTADKLYLKLLQTGYDEIPGAARPKPQPPAAPASTATSAAPRPQSTAGNPQSTTNAGNAQVPNAQKYAVGDKQSKINPDGSRSIVELKDVGGGKLDWVDVTPKKSAPK
jgi:hypothetical protein